MNPAASLRCSYRPAFDGQGNPPPATLEEEAVKTNLKRACLSAVIGGVFSAMLGGTVFAQAADPQVGDWKLNVQKSSFSPGPLPKSGTTKIEAAGAGAKLIVDQTMADGSARRWGFTANYDGKDVPITGNNPDADTVARTRVNANTVETVSKKAGKVVITQQSTVSADGKTRTVTTKGVNAAGKPVNNIAVYERQ
jgi:hypothetical protein